MAKKIEQWQDNEGCNHDTEFEGNNLTDVWDDTEAAIDALHEYAHRGDGPDYGDGTDAEGFPGGDARMGTALPEGVPPELDDWVKRWEWITARVTLDQVLAMKDHDQVRIGLEWWDVPCAGGRSVTLRTPTGETVYMWVHELDAIANEVRYNGR